VAPYLGQCLCGAVRYRVHREPLAVYACHCTDCQRRTGSAFAMSMIVRPEDLELVDTPGVRMFGLWGIGPGELDHAYPEFRPLLGRCRFADCAHESEPGCAVREAVARGEIAARRYASFAKLKAELATEASREPTRSGGSPS